MNHKMIIISLDGLIGAGKTTLMKAIADKFPDIVTCVEPVGFWSSLKNKEGQSLLELFYTDKHRWAYTFQNCALLSRMRSLKETIASHPDKQIFIMERSLLTDRYVFAEMLYNDGLIDSLEWELYLQWYQTLSDQVSGVIYIDTCVETSMERIRRRNRPGEEKITDDYLRELDDQHKKWISQMSLPNVTISTESGVDIDETLSTIGQFVARLMT